MTAKDSRDGVFGDIASAVATAAWNIANYVLDGCRLTHAGANLQRFGILGDTELDPCMLHPLAQFQEDVFQTPESRPRKAVACLKKTWIKSTNKAVKLILGQINAPRLPNGRYQKLQPPALKERSQSKCPSPTTSSTAIAAT